MFAVEREETNGFCEMPSMRVTAAIRLTWLARTDRRRAGERDECTDVSIDVLVTRDENARDC